MRITIRIMNTKKKKKKKKPSEYPLFAVRLTEQQKSQLSDMIDGVRKHLNKGLASDDKLWMKNDVVFQALKIGLPLLKKKARRED